MEIYWGMVYFLFGIVIGSFFNVVGLRVPEKVSFITGRSYCPTCQYQLRWHELLPVVSFCWQKGKCRHCRAKIPILYPVMEFLTGFLLMYSYFWLGFTVELMTALLLISMLVVVSVSDIAYMLIPDYILLFFLPLLMICRIISPLDPWYDALLGAATGYLLVALIIFISRGGMGAGDMKLLFVLGLVLGWKHVLLTFFLAALMGSIVGMILKRLNKVASKQPIPFGPYIAMAAVIAYFHGDWLITSYVALF